MSEKTYHWVETKVYDESGECVAINQSYVPGEFKPDEMTLHYWAWLDERREETASEDQRESS